MTSTTNAAQARAAAAQVVAQVVAGRYLDRALEEQRAQCRSEDAALIQELAYGTLRWYHRLSGIAKLFLTRPLKSKDADIHALLLIGLYQLRHMRVANHAAVDVTVGATEVLNKGWAKGLINACLRAALRESARIEETIATNDNLRYSHPAWLIAAVRQDHPQTWQRILDANNERPPLTLRVNTQRTTRADYLAQLTAQGLAAHAHPWVESALVVETPVPVEKLPGFSAGLVSVQDAAAQLAAIWLDAQPGERVLDACAAPGGKSAHILERTPAIAELTALDVDADRVERLRAGLARLQLNARTLVGDAVEPSAWWDGTPYDRILVDAPCSATGVVRRHPDIKVRRQADELAQLTDTQARILDGVWPCLKPGGKLLYVTCSLLRAENERLIQDFMQRHPDAVSEALVSGESDSAERQLLPGEDEMDGFYYAGLRKT
ncbi:MAG: 16S rRNA (cytosine(967)-C(5))-methyltransferase RsmB [Gammaproteobacteria bacterium]|nr:16S rRNA (cytosine(967)-C(5))-methyltransferase RsmB [Gammaproteobacteria bacterium]